MDSKKLLLLDENYNYGSIMVADEADEQTDNLEIKNFSHFKSKCICYCCTKASCCMSSNRMELTKSSSTSSNSNSESKNRNYKFEFRLKKLIKFRKFNLLFFKLFFKLFSNIINPKKPSSQRSSRKFNLLRSLIPLFVCLLFVYVFFVLMAHIYSFNSSIQENYDLMKHALRNQNVTRHKIMCNPEEPQIKLKFSKKTSDKYKLFSLYYVVNFSSNETTKENIKIFDLYYGNLLSNSEDKHFVELLNKMKFCILNDYKTNFKSKSVYSNSILNLKYIMQKPKDLNEYESILINSSPNLKLGGYFKPPLCLQEFLYYNANDDQLQELKLIIENFNKRESNKPQDLFNLLNNLSKFSYDIIRSQYYSSINKYNLIQEYIKSKENDFTVIIIPYLNRENNLIDLLYNLHSFLQRQFIHYRIVIAEQYNSNDPFNKGRLYNTAYKYVTTNLMNQNSKLKVNCLILHDVDLIPESDFNIYDCSGGIYVNQDDYDNQDENIPRHLSLSIRSDSDKLFDLNQILKFNLIDLYKQSPYELLVGGVLCIKPHVYKLINGFSNEYWNWGAEDDGTYF